MRILHHIGSRRPLRRLLIGSCLLLLIWLLFATVLNLSSLRQTSSVEFLREALERVSEMTFQVKKRVFGSTPVNNLERLISKRVCRSCDLDKVDLNKMDLTGVNLTEAILTNTNLTGAILRGTNLSSAKLIRAKLSSADLTGANLTGADLTDVDMTPAILRGANLSNTDLAGRDFS